MATPYSGVTDDPKSLQTSIDTPDFSFLQSQLYRSNQQYEQGLSQVKNDYSSILNSDLSNPENLEQRKQYISQIQEGLKKIAPSDLSLPQNVQQAENLYAPFWQDQDILHDQAATRQIRSELGKGEADRTAKDKDVRDSYNPNSIQQLQWSQQDLQNAKRGDGSIAAVGKDLPRYTPQIDPTSYMDDVDKAQGFKGADFEYADGHGGLIKEHDGLKAVPQFTTRIDAALGAKFNPQFSVQGYNWYRQEKAVMLAQNPGITPEQINQKLGEYRYNELKGMYQNKVTSLQADIKKSFDDPIALIQNAIKEQKGKITPQQQQDLTKLNNQKQDYIGALQQAQDDNDHFQREPDKVIADIAKDPVDYYTRQIRETTINNMARGRALGDHSVTMDVDKAWEAASQDANWRTNAKLRSQDINKDYYVANLKHTDEHEKNLIDAGYTYDVSGRLIPPTNTPGTAQPQYVGEDITSVQHGHFSEILEQEKNTNLQTAVQATYSPNGVTGVLTIPADQGGLGISPSVLTDFNTLYKRLNTSENIANPDFKQTPAEKAAFLEVYHKLGTYFGADKPIPFTYEGVTAAIHKYIADQNVKRITTGTFTDANNPFAQAFASSEIAKQALNNYTSMSKQEQDWISHMATAEKDKYHPLLNDAGTGFATIQDVAKHVPVHEGTDEAGNHVTVTPEDYAKAFLQKTLIVDKARGRISLDGGRTHIHIDKVNGKDNTNWLVGSSHIGEHGPVYPTLTSDTGDTYDKLTERFGTTDSRDELNKQLADNAAQNLKFVKDKTGTIGGKFLYSFGNDKTPGFGEKLIYEALQPSNTYAYYDSKGNQIDPKDVDKIRGLANSYKNIRDNIGQPTRSQVSEYGQPITQFSVNSWTDKDGKIHSGETITAVQSPDAKGEAISSAPRANNTYIYDKILRGESFESDDMTNSMGFKYSIQPDDRTHPTAVSIYITRKKFNPAHQQIEDFTYPVKTVPINQGIDNIMREVSKMQTASILDLANEQKQVNQRDAK